MNYYITIIINICIILLISIYIEVSNEQNQQLKKEIKKQISKVIYMKNITYQQRTKNASILLKTVSTLNPQEISGVLGLFLSHNGLEKISIDLK